MQKTTIFALLLLLAASLPATRPAEAKRKYLTMRQKKARKLYKAGQTAYAAKRYQKAAETFAGCYALDPRPGFLLNIGQSYRLAGDKNMALTYYKRYLKVAPRGSFTAQVKGLIAEIEREIEATKKSTLPPPVVPEVKPPPITEPPPPPIEAKKPIYKKWWLWAAVGAVVITSVTVSVAASASGPDYVKEGQLGAIRW